MKSLFAFIKKEVLEQLRSGRLFITLALFLMLGIMNPVIAKLTPWLLEMMSETLAESGMTVTEVEITAMDSWTQYFKNLPLGLFAFVLLHGSVFTKEYESGTLVLSLTKGLERFKVVIAKAGVLTLLWSLCYWLSFGVTYLYNAYYWDNSAAKSLSLAVVGPWLLGVLAVSLITLFSVLSSTLTGVLLGTGGVVLASYVLSLFPKPGKYLPTRLLDGAPLLYGTAESEAYTAAMTVTLLLAILCFAVSIPLFNKKHL